MTLYDFLIVFPTYQRVQLAMDITYDYDGYISEIPAKYLLPKDGYLVEKAESNCEGVWIEIRKNIKEGKT